MSTGSATQKDLSQLKGIFKTKTQLDAFVQPLRDLSSVMDENGVVLNVSKDKKTINIYALNKSKGVYAFVSYKKELFDGFNFESDEKIGIYRLAEFVKFLSVLEESDITIEFKDTIFSVSHELGVMSLKTSDATMIQEAPTSFKGAGWLSELAIDNRFSKLRKAMSALSNEDSVYVTGSTSKGTITFLVRSASNEANSYKLEIAAKPTQDFETVFGKDMLQNLLSFNTNFTASFSNRIVQLHSENEFSTSTYFVAKKQEVK